MHWTRLAPCLTGALLACATPPMPREPPPDAWALTRARLSGQPGEVTLLIEGGRIATLTDAPPSHLPTIDAAGGYVLPGLIDHHTHLYSGALAQESLDLTGVRTVAEVQVRLRDYAALHLDAPWIVGRGWTYDLFPGGATPHRGELDAAVADRPVFLEAYDGHSAWVNSRALELAQREGHRPSDAAAEGHLVEAEVAGVEALIPAPSPAETRALLLAGAEHLRSLGLVEVHDIVREAHVLEAYLELDRQRRLPLRVQVSLLLDAELERWLPLMRKHPAHRLSFGPLKGFVDGVIESRTAFMLDDYATGAGKGHPLLSRAELDRLVTRAVAAGFAVRLHAIGDAAVRLALDVFEAHPPPPGQRHQIEHLEVTHPDDLPRFAGLGVVASMQPFHANPFGDQPELGTWAKNLGPEREARSFAWRSLLEAGAQLVFGSDWPVMSANPLHGLAVAMTRQDELGRPGGGWQPAQRIGFEAALSAYAGRAQLGLGDPADLVILEPGVDPRRPDELWRARVRCVSVGGDAPSCPEPRAADGKDP